MKATERGASITRRLLAFARRADLRVAAGGHRAPLLGDLQRLAGPGARRRRAAFDIDAQTDLPPPAPTPPNSKRCWSISPTTPATRWTARAPDFFGAPRDDRRERQGAVRPGDYVAPRRHRHRRRHGRGHARARVRAVLHHQAGRQGHRARPVDGARLRRTIRRRAGDRQRTRRRNKSDAVAAGRERRDGGEPSSNAPTRASRTPADQETLIAEFVLRAQGYQVTTLADTARAKAHHLPIIMVTGYADAPRPAA